MLKRILVATDGSQLSSKAVDTAIEFARRFDARVLAIHVHLPFHAPYGMHEPATEVLHQTHEDQGRRYAERLFADIRARTEAAGVPFDSLFMIGNEVWKEIIAVARRKKCDLICMASHGHRGFRALVLGSETQKVLTHAKMPVLVLH